MTINIRKLQNIIATVVFIIDIILLGIEFKFNAYTTGLLLLTIGMSFSGIICTFLQRHTGNHVDAKYEQ